LINILNQDIILCRTIPYTWMKRMQQQMRRLENVKIQNIIIILCHIVSITIAKFKSHKLITIKEDIHKPTKNTTLENNERFE